MWLQLISEVMKAWGNGVLLTRDCRLAPSLPAQSGRKNSRPRQAHSDWDSGRIQPWPSTKDSATTLASAKNRNLYIKRFLSWQRRRQGRNQSSIFGLLACFKCWQHGIKWSWSIETSAGHPSPPPPAHQAREGNEPLDGMQWHTDTCFVASQVVADSGWRSGGKNTVKTSLEHHRELFLTWAEPSHCLPIHPHCIMISWSIPGTSLQWYFEDSGGVHVRFALTGSDDAIV